MTLLNRFQAIDQTDRLDALPIVEGSRRDYLVLKPHHYRPGNPATMSRIFAIHDEQPTASDRYLSRPLSPRPIAVLVESMPVLMCRPRELALGGRYVHLPLRSRAGLMNEEVRTISRVIVDPRYRGLGLAVRLLRHALATATTRYTESLAVMGRVSPFFERAGMTAYEYPPSETNQRLLAALTYADIEPALLTQPSAIAKQMTSLESPMHQLIMQELRRWYRATVQDPNKREVDLQKLLDAARQRLLAEPIYYLYENTHVHAPPTASPACFNNSNAATGSA